MKRVEEVIYEKEIKVMGNKKGDVKIVEYLE